VDSAFGVLRAPYQSRKEHSVSGRRSFLEHYLPRNEDSEFNLRLFRRLINLARLAVYSTLTSLRSLANLEKSKSFRRVLLGLTDTKQKLWKDSQLSSLLCGMLPRANRHRLAGILPGVQKKPCNKIYRTSYWKSQREKRTMCLTSRLC